MDYALTRDIDNKIRPLLERGDTVAWIGAGLSTAMGYPGWEDTIDQLSDRCGVPRVSVARRKTARLAEVMMGQAEKCKAHAPAIYAETIHAAFEKNTYVSRDSLNYLVQLPFRAFITT